MANNHGVVYLGPNKVEVQSIDYPKLENPAGKKIEHAVILKVVTTNICGSDQHMVRGRTTAPKGLVLGHEITGEIIEKGADVEYLEIGDLVTDQDVVHGISRLDFNVTYDRRRRFPTQNVRQHSSRVLVAASSSQRTWIEERRPLACRSRRLADHG